MSRTLGWLLACALLSACSSSTPLTQIMVVVRSDIELARADIVVDGLGKQQVASAKLSKQKLPRTLAIVYRGGPLGPITVRARGYDASDTLLVERVAKLSFVRGRNVTLVLDLAQQCVGVSCPGGDTCIAGGCSDFKVDSKKLQDWPGAVGKVDAGTIVMGGDAAADGGELDAMVSNPDSGGSFGGDAAMDAGSDAEIDSGQVITGCDADHADCNKDGVCETSLTTTDDCGGCNKKCDFDNNVVAPAGTLSCPKQVCKVTCPSDRIDFDHKPGTGCEGTAFTYVPAHVDMDDATVRSKVVPALTVSCDQLVDFGAAALPATLKICGKDVKPLLVTQSGGPDLVVIGTVGLTIEQGHTLAFAGARPVVLVVFGDATIAGTLSASATGATPGAGGGASCTVGSGAAGATGSSGGGGGGGGAFGSAGGGGGDSQSGASGGSKGAVEGDAALTVLRGGCSGGLGGNTGGAGGGGGGALQLSVAGTLTVTGTVAAAGGGGRSPASAVQAGGGGGGSGGAIVLEANLVSLASSAWVTVNGGGGAEAAGTDSADGMGGPGTPGEDGALTGQSAAQGGDTSGIDVMGDGGDGAAGASTAKDGNNGNLSFPLGSSRGGGGGGGGGVGRIVINGVTCDDSGNSSPNTACM